MSSKRCGNLRAKYDAGSQDRNKFDRVSEFVRDRIVDRLLSVVRGRMFAPPPPSSSSSSSIDSSIGDTMSEEVIFVAFSNILMVYTQ